VEHLAGDLDVDGVDVVEEARVEEAADLEDEPGEDEDRDRARAPEAARRGGLRESVLHWYWFSGFVS
jgi:hypothetical protein